MLIYRPGCDGPYLDYSILTVEAGGLGLEASLVGRLQSEAVSQKNKVLWVYLKGSFSSV